ncbi:MAG: hypothetical protein IJM02_00455 [Clostridia bacterium]|jgi:hypothetical protein|nr:hypothetical protein [Clostridia bacterium]
MKKKLLSAAKYPPRCSYCKRGRLSPDGESVLCDKKGIVDKNSSCRSYRYDVMKRVPEKPAEIPGANPEDFEI